MSALFEESTLKKPKEIGSSNESQALRAASKKERKKGMFKQAFFLDNSKKTQAEKNSKLKENLEKTQAKFRKNSKTGNSS